jgi:hypothetical protein
MRYFCLTGSAAAAGSEEETAQVSGDPAQCTEGQLQGELNIKFFKLL